MFRSIFKSVGLQSKFKTLERCTTLLVLVDVLIRVPSFVTQHMGATALTIAAGVAVWLGEEI